MILNERLIRMALTLAEELHFGRAASILHVSQPALSAAITNLEQDLGTRLFKRTSRNVELTNAGRVFVVEARRLAQASDIAIARIRQSASEALGPLRIGYAISINFQWLWSLAAGLRMNGLSGDQLVFVSAETSDLREALIKGDLHAVLGPINTAESALQTISLRREHLKAVLHRKHPLASRSSVRLRNLQDCPVVWLRGDLNSSAYNDLVSQCGEHGYLPDIAQQVRTFHECLQFVGEGLGITFLPAYMEAQCRNRNAVFKRIAGGSLYLHQSLTYRPMEDSNTLARFLELFRGSDFCRPDTSRDRARD